VKKTPTHRPRPRQQPSSTRAARVRETAFTLIEVLIAIAIVAVLATIAVPAYSEYLERGRIAQAKTDIVNIDQTVARFELSNNGRVPDSLDQIGGAPRDPWGNPYQYLNLRNPANLGNARKDHNLHPINTDYDLYSMGRDGASVKPLTAGPSRDDIIRGRDGRFIGKATDF
jgi:general secretion pathway protein G